MHKDSRPFLAHDLATSNYRGTSLNRKRTPLGTYSRTLPRALQWPYRGCTFLGDGYKFDHQISPRQVPGHYDRAYTPTGHVRDGTDISLVLSPPGSMQGYLAHKKTHPPRTLP